MGERSAVLQSRRYALVCGAAAQLRGRRAKVKRSRPEVGGKRRSRVTKRAIRRALRVLWALTVLFVALRIV